MAPNAAHDFGWLALGLLSGKGLEPALLEGIGSGTVGSGKRDRSDIAKSGDFSACPYCQ